ncbi:2,5-dioxovalerate dehydrogenase [Natronorubrum halophilum]|uniref:2,5-dioxovalerate dehydrogenase n=1 Tax=Natronorubrum halophilum TaxID=1702106 RepID=UPI0010C16723|nr:aldehyde dehydrogenase family protein [Natronorubrum halophilum]
MPSKQRNFIGGAWVKSTSGETFENRNPADISDVIGHYQQSTAEDTEAAIDAANEASNEWAGTPGPERGRILRKASEILAERKEQLTETLSREVGKTMSESSGEVQRAIDIYAYYAAKASDFGGSVKASSNQSTHLYSENEPLGVAGLITPWNFPIAIASWKMAPALAAGNTVVLKPASLAPEIVLELVEALEEAGIPDGVVNFVTGPGRAVGSTIAASPAVDAVSFTGSHSVGEKVREQAAKDGKRVQLELGGKNPTIVMPTADIDSAVDIVADGCFGVTGEACTATSKALVHEDIYEEFVDEMTAHVDGIEIGPGLEDYDMGPHVSESELESTLDYIEVGKREGATLETGGNQLTGGVYENGYFVEPTVFSDVTNDMRIAQEEIFGPVLGIIPVSSFEDALAQANDVRYGLAAGLVSQNLSEAHEFATRAEAGIIKVNEKTTGLELHVPFGGFKDSSSETYREQGDAGLDFYSISRTVYINYQQ